MEIAVLLLLTLMIIFLITGSRMVGLVALLAAGGCAAEAICNRNAVTGGARHIHSKHNPLKDDPKAIEAVKKHDLKEFDGELLSPDEIDAIKKHYSSFIPLSELNTVPANLPTNLPYRSRSKVNRFIATHMGQRKLLLTEIDFLTDFAKEGDLIVYAGAASGVHIPFLASLFKSLKLKYHLYDPRDFDMRGDTSMIKTFQQLFLEDDAAKYAGRGDVLFISDIRTGGGDDSSPGEEDVKFDMKLQKSWVARMKPRASMLKFRLEYTPSEPTTKYLCGEVRIQAWPPLASSETRLIVTDVKDCEYNSFDYDRQMYYHNAVEREWFSYDHGIPSDMVRGIDSCYDCAYEVHIWKKYIERFNPGGDITKKIADLMNTTSRNVRRNLFEPPHGLHPDMLIKDKRNEVATYRVQ